MTNHDCVVKRKAHSAAEYRTKNAMENIKYAGDRVAKAFVSDTKDFRFIFSCLTFEVSAASATTLPNFRLGCPSSARPPVALPRTNRTAQAQGRAAGRTGQVLGRREEEWG